VCTGTLSMVVKWPGCETHHLPPSSAMVKIKWSYISSSSLCLHDMCWCYLYFVLIFMFTYHPEITWICVCTQCTQVNVFLSFFVLIFCIFITHGYLYILLMMCTECSWMHNRVMVINISWILAHIMMYATEVFSLCTGLYWLEKR
jgi:hypothetical protein